MKQICGFDEEHRTPYGFTDVYVIDHSEMQPLNSLGLMQERIADALAFLPPFDQIISNSYYFPGIEMQARGTEQIALFWQADPSGLIKELWLNPFWTRGESDLQFLERTLKTLGAIAPVLLADWERLCCVDLTQEEAIDRYLQMVSNELGEWPDICYVFYFQPINIAMKKRQFLTLCLLLFGALIGLQSCDDEKTIAFDKLPQTARQFIGDYFPDQTVNRVEQEKDHGTVSYEVRLSDGTEIDFDAAGEWQHIDRPFGIVPDGIVPQAILNDLADRYPDARIHEIEKELGGYEIGIGNGMELYYTTEGVFIRAER